ncbi:MAG TPA: hypothetical protein VI383_03205, partial [Gemmatimonadales bacterium]|nr:hypothetical protein [Gemmatimonadales bacterium]
PPPWPRGDRRARDPVALRRFAALQELVGSLRSIRAEYGVPPGQAVRATVGRPGPDLREVLRSEKSVMARLAKLSALETSGQEDPAAGTANAVLSDGSAVSIPLGDMVNLGKECARLKAEADRLGTVIRSQEVKLDNQDFVTRAPSAVVAREREKLATWREQAAVLVERQRRLGCG